MQPLFFASTALLLSSCATFFTDSDPDSDRNLALRPPAEIANDLAGPNSFQLTPSEKSLYLLPYWQVSGRISIRSADDGMSGQLRWRQHQENFLINFNAPFGQGAVQIVGDAVGVELKTADGRSLQADDLDQLFDEAVGWELPLAGLRYWLAGVPSPGSQAVLQRQPDSAGEQQLATISHIRQFFWDVEIPRYVQVGDRLLPRKLKLRNEEIQVRLVIDRWWLDNETEIATKTTP